VLTYLTRPATPPAASPPLLVLLHSFGSNEADLFGLAPQLDARFQVVSLRAPHALGGPAYAWFSLEFTPNGIVADVAQAVASHRLLGEEIRRLVAETGADPGRVYLLGFSQGAIMAAALALRSPGMTAGAVLMSGRIMPEMLPEPNRSAGVPVPPIMVVHGVFDDVLPIANGRASRDLLTGMGIDLDYREYRMAHAVSAESLADVAGWLRARLDGAASRPRL
jgi:phospholipase/carboxylesterase